MKTLTIGQLAKKAQVKVETVRYYERRGLIPEPPRRESGYPINTSLLFCLALLCLPLAIF
jgi:hypothetical protein